MAPCYALVPAAGGGSRFGASLPKQYLPLLERPLLAHTLDVLCSSPLLSAVLLVLAAEDTWWAEAGFSHTKLKVLSCGGLTRAESVLNGLRMLMNQGARAEDWVLVHDAARPCLSLSALTRLIETVRDDAVGGILAVPLADTLKREDGNTRIAATLARDGLWQAQTPQMFRAGLLLEALNQSTEVTDEASAVEALGLHPRLVPGDLGNLKVTYPGDLVLAEAILRGRQQREETHR